MRAARAKRKPSGRWAIRVDREVHRVLRGLVDDGEFRSASDALRSLLARDAGGAAKSNVI